MNCDRYKQVKERVKKESQCRPQIMYCIGATGPTGPTGPAGDSSACCDCIDQMRNIIQQIIDLYPDNNIFVTLDSGDLIFGKPTALIPGPSGTANIFEVNNPSSEVRQLASLCSIDSITIDNAVYNDTISYLPAPVPTPTGCCADCESDIRSILPVGTTDVSIITNGNLASLGTVIKNEYGMIVLTNTLSRIISFVSVCKIDAIFLG